DLGALDASAIARVVAEAAPAPRDADELHDALLSLVVMPVNEVGEAPAAWLDALIRGGRAGVVTTAAGAMAFAAESAGAIAALYPGADWGASIGARRGGGPASLPVAPIASIGRDEALHAAARGYAEIAGPFTTEALARRLGVEDWEAKVAVARLESEGGVL